MNVTARRDNKLTLLALGWVGGAFVAAILFEISVLAGAPLHTPPSSSEFTSTLLSTNQSGRSFVTILAKNVPWEVALSVLALLIARVWSTNITDMNRRSRRRVRAFRFAYTFTAAVVFTSLWWILSRQAAALSAELTSSWALFLALPHGPIEFTALFLPFFAAIDCARHSGVKPERAIGLSVAIAIPLLVIAALLEAYVSPVIYSLDMLR